MGHVGKGPDVQAKTRYSARCRSADAGRCLPDEHHVEARFSSGFWGSNATGTRVKQGVASDVTASRDAALFPRDKESFVRRVGVLRHRVGIMEASWGRQGTGIRGHQGVASEGTSRGWDQGGGIMGWHRVASWGGIRGVSGGGIRGGIRGVGSGGGHHGGILGHQGVAS